MVFHCQLLQKGHDVLAVLGVKGGGQVAFLNPDGRYLRRGQYSHLDGKDCRPVQLPARSGNTFPRQGFQHFHFVLLNRMLI